MYCLGSRLYINWPASLPATHNCIQASKAIQTAFLSVPEEQLQNYVLLTYIPVAHVAIPKHHSI